MTDLSCMDGANVAAIALQLEQTALQAEASIFSAEQRLRAALNRPTIVQRSTVLITGIVADPFTGDQPIGPAGGGTFVTDFNNTGIDRNIDSTSRVIFGELGEGVYEIGISANLIASGAVNDLTYRQFRIVNSRQDPTQIDGQFIVQEASLTLFETNTAIGTDATVVGTFRVKATDRIKFLVSHGNTSSTLNSSIGALVWLSKLSSNDSVVIV